MRFCQHGANPVLESNEEGLEVRFWVRFCHHSANPVLDSYGEKLEVDEHAIYRHRILHVECILFTTVMTKKTVVYLYLVIIAFVNLKSKRLF